MKGDSVTKILLVVVLLLLVFNLIKSKGSENVVWGEPGRTVVAGAALPRGEGMGGPEPTIFRFWSDGTVDAASVSCQLLRLWNPWKTLQPLEKKSRR